MGAPNTRTPIQRLPDGRRVVICEGWFNKPGGRGGTGKRHQEHVEVYSYVTFADDSREEFVFRLWPRDGELSRITDVMTWDYWQATNKRLEFEPPLLVIVRQDDNGVWRLQDVKPPDTDYRVWLANENVSEDLLDWLEEIMPIMNVHF